MICVLGYLYMYIYLLNEPIPVYNIISNEWTKYIVKLKVSYINLVFLIVKGQKAFQPRLWCFWPQTKDKRCTEILPPSVGLRRISFLLWPKVDSPTQQKNLDCGTSKYKIVWFYSEPPVLMYEIVGE